MDAGNNPNSADDSSLEGSTTVVEPTAGSPVVPGAPAAAPGQPAGDTATPPTTQPKRRFSLRYLFRRFYIYLLAFILLLVVAGVVGTIFYLKSQNGTIGSNVPSQALTQDELNQLANSDVSVGEPQHTLNVQSNAVFAGSVLMRGNLQIAGTLQVGNNLAINGVRVTGNSTFDDVQITHSLSLTGNASIQGQLNVQSNLGVNGTGTFQGALSAPSITVSALQLNGNLNLTHHITAGGGTPARSNGSALGGGGTATVSGSDTAGSVNINTGSSPGVGCFVTITFASAFNSTPHIVITPVGAAAAGIDYYITRTTTTFSICTTSAAPGGTSFGFDYLAFD